MLVWLAQLNQGQVQRSAERLARSFGVGARESTRAHRLRFGATVAAALVLAGTADAHRLPAKWLKGAACIHRHEAAWKDGGAPYYGGMQMDWDFMDTYGRWALHHLGTADRWPRWLQLHVAFRAWKVRGWAPWPNTARACGLSTAPP